MPRSAGPGRRHSRVGRARSAVRALEAVGLVSAAAAAQRWVPMPKWSRYLGEPSEVPREWAGRQPEGIPPRAGSLTERQVAVAVARACRVLPFEPTCLAQAAAGQVMLRQRGEPGTVVVGLRPPDRPPSDPPRRAAPAHDGPAQADSAPERVAGSTAPEWAAHAWLIGSAGALIGGPAAEGFTATTAFRPARGDSAGR